MKFKIAARAGVIFMVTGLTVILIPSTAFAGSTDHFIMLNLNQAYGWCGASSGYPVILGDGCNDQVWTFTSETKFAGYTAYEITNNGLCATVATGNGAHYTQNDVVMEGCVGASNQYFVNPSNPGNLDSDWAGYYYGCSALSGHIDSAGANEPVYAVNYCTAPATNWNIPLD
jgi:hypothetical protein